jgi:hypothetical protein
MENSSTPEERRLCVILAYALMGLKRHNADRFEIIAQTIMDNAPELADFSRGRELLRELLIVKGGRAARDAVGR